ncbi:MAG TPA: M14 family metallopeptidase [Candidatus Wallbacteria bacterium]|nr:M14 family metallopeptidase [Candidatus Wallbacteria bacterium]
MKKLGLLSLGAAILLSLGSFNQSFAANNQSIEQLRAETENPMIVKIATDGRSQVAAIANMGFDIAEVKNGAVTIVATKTNLKKLDKRAYKYTIINPDANSLLTRFRAGTTLGKYHTYEQVQQILKDAEANNPNICKVSVIGKSFEGRDIYAINITGNINAKAKKPAGLIMGLHHSREWISVEVPLALIKELTEKYAKDDNIKKLVDGRDIWIVPVVNPDGLVYSQTKSKMWRKNRRLNSDKSYGVDPNRNYGYEWGDVGSSNYMGDDTYHGTKAFSEPCTQAIKKLAEEHNFVGDITFHSYSELILYPFSYAYEAVAKDEKILAQIAGEMAKLNGYTPQKSSDLYPSMGDTDDFMYGACGSLSFTIELASTFVPADSAVPKICDDNVKACLCLLDKIGTMHASTHPDFASKTVVATARYLYAAAVSNQRDVNAKNALVNLLNPVNDNNSANLEEFISEIAKSDLKSKQLLLPVIKEVKSMYMTEVLNRTGNTHQTLRKLEKLQAEINNIE